MTYILGVHISTSMTVAICRENEILSPMTFSLSTSLTHAINVVLQEVYEAYGICVNTSVIAVDGSIHNNASITPIHVNPDEIYKDTMLGDVMLIPTREAGMAAVHAADGYDLRHPNGDRPPSQEGGSVALLMVDKRLSSAYSVNTEDGMLVMRSEQGANDTDAYLNFRGFLDIYREVKETLDEGNDMRYLIESMEDAEKITSVIRYRSHCDTCEITLRRFVEYLAFCARNNCLILQPYGGLYIWQNLEPTLNHILKRPYFMYSFEKHPSKREYLRHIPVRVIDDPFLVLKGCYHISQMKMR